MANIIRAAWERTKDSLFLVPAAIVALSAALARLLVVVDRRAEAVLEEFPLLPATVAGSRAILSTVAGATITVAAIVFSMTAVTVQLASSQYSPRILNGFMRDRFQQTVIGLVVGTFVYCLLVLTVTHPGAGVAGPEAPPSTALTAGVVLGVTSVLAIVAFIDHIIDRVRIEDVVRRIADETIAVVRRVHPQPGEEPPTELEPWKPKGGTSIAVRTDIAGWVNRVDPDKLLRLLPPRSIARLDVGVGEHISVGNRVATVWLAEGAAADRVRVRRFLVVARRRSGESDVAFGIRQLVDIALRALSPGINDPTTAIDAIQHMAGPLREVLTRPLPARVRIGEEQRRVYLPEARGYAAYVHGAFREIRLNAADQPNVITTLLATIADLLDEIEPDDREARGAALVAEAQLAIDAARASDVPAVDWAAAEAIAERLGLDRAAAT